jgi:hypothetical protein
MKCKRALALFGLVCVAGPGVLSAQPRVSGEILARELYHEERGPNRRALWTADAMIARHPIIFRALRAQALRELPLTEDCSAQLPCNRYMKDELSYSGSRLVSIFSTTDQFLGGAHGAVGVSDAIYDLRTNRRIRFRDLFTNWARAKALLQPKICESLRQMRENMEGIECPDADSLAFGLTEAGEIPIGRAASGFEVRMSDYALGSYAAGREDLWVTLDRPLYNLIKAEYRADFRVGD